MQGHAFYYGGYNSKADLSAAATYKQDGQWQGTEEVFCPRMDIHDLQGHEIDIQTGNDGAASK